MNLDDKKKNVDKLRDSSYDGIQEYDNDLPRWWVWIFYLTGVYGVVYCIGVYFFGVTIPPIPYDPSGQPLAGVAQNAALSSSPGDEEKVLKEYLLDPARISKGAEVFAARCVACHGAQGGGLVGPNLTDEYWIHGGAPVQVQKVIEDGVLDKGMLSWKSMLSKDDIRSLVAFIRSLRGTHPSGAKDPQGEKYSE